MEIERRDTYAVEMVLNTMSPLDVWSFSEAYPMHYEAVDHYWNNMHEINVDDIKPYDAPKLIHVLKKCRNLKKITYSKTRMDDTFKTIPQVAATYCPSLEDLNFLGLYLTAKDTELLSGLTMLRKISFYVQEYSMSLETLLVNNPMLELVHFGGDIKDSCFAKIPKTIKDFVLSSHVMQGYDNLFLNIQSWRLEKLGLYFCSLNLEHIRILYQQSTLVSVLLTTRLQSSDVLNPLFESNPRLQEVFIHGNHKDDYTNLRILSRSVTRLKLCCNFQDETPAKLLLEYLQTSRIEELYLNSTGHTVLSGLPRAVPNLRVLNMLCFETSKASLSHVQYNKKLKSLTLLSLFKEHEDSLTAIARSCLSLEAVHLVMDMPPHMPNNAVMLKSVAALPQLKQLHLDGVNFSKTSNTFFIKLSKSLTLRSVIFRDCTGLTNEDVLILIRRCTTLMKFTIMGCPSITKDLLHGMAHALHEQTNRQNVLYMTFIIRFLRREELTEVRPHPLLELVQLETWFE